MTFDNAFVTANPVPGGAYEYWCDVHLSFGMVGVVRVAGPVPAFPAWAAVSTGLLVLAGGAFLLRGSAEALASQMEVSKVTLYAYLNAVGD